MRDYTKFFTYPETAKFMVKLLNPQPDCFYLEPSAGDGNLIREIRNACPDCTIVAIELDKRWQLMLEKIADVVEIIDFLKFKRIKEFDGCVANPPFGNGVDLQAHFDNICELVKDGGKVVMIVPMDFNPNYSKHFVKNLTAHNLENWSKNSDGTTTEIKIIEFSNSAVHS